MNILIILALIISFSLDLFLLNFLPFALNDITFIYPMLFFTTNLLLFKYLSKKNLVIFIIMITIYSALVFNNIILGISIFTVIYYINNLLMEKNIFLRSVLSFIIYDLIIYLALVIFSNYHFNINFYFYKLVRSLIFNLIYLSIFNLVLKRIEP